MGRVARPTPPDDPVSSTLGIPPLWSGTDLQSVWGHLSPGHRIWPQLGMTGETVAIPRDIEERVRRLCLALPKVTVRIDESRSKWRSTAHSFDIRRRSFCLLVATMDPVGMRATRLVLRADPDDREALLSMGYPYFVPRARSDRVGVVLTNETDWDEICELVTESYRILAPKKLIALLDQESYSEG
jgi:YjbR protein